MPRTRSTGRPPRLRRPRRDLELPEDWRASIPERLAELAEAWKAPEAWEGMSKAGGLEMPGAVTGLVANNEVVLHAWDLAVATGQPYAVAPENLQASWQMVYDTPDASGRGA